MLLNNAYEIDSYDKFLNQKKVDVDTLIDDLSNKTIKIITSKVCDCLFASHKYIVPNESDLKEKIESLVIDYYINFSSVISIYIQRQKKAIFDCVNKDSHGFNINTDELLKRSKINEQLLSENFFEEVSPNKRITKKIINHIDFRNQMNQSYIKLEDAIENEIINIVDSDFEKHKNEFVIYIEKIIDSLKNTAYQFNSYVYNENENNLNKTNNNLSMGSILEDVQNNRDPFKKQNSESELSKEEIHAKNESASKNIDISNLTEEQKNELIYGKTEDEILTNGKSK